MEFEMTGHSEGVPARYWIDPDGVLRGVSSLGLRVCRPATDAELWFQAERDRLGETLELVSSSETRGCALDAAFAAKGRKLSCTEEQWLAAALDVVVGKMSSREGG